MKILSLHFKNLNSLAGEWDIDFTRPEYTADGIFAITGPTGSGKSTILDAICLALYGQTPRLGRVTKSVNEIMSRQTGECFSEVVFETGAGRFRCHWSQHRARRHAGGELQSQKHEISEAESGKILESKLQDTLQAVIERTGMDFDQFTRSMLLAQGGFAVFLQAPPDERAPVLEQITGTAIYSAISMKVHERNREEQLKLEQLRAECSGIRLLDENTLASIGAELHENEAQEALTGNRQREVEAALRWLRQIASMKAELAGMEDEFRELERYEEGFLPDRDRLEQGRLAARFEPAYTALWQMEQLQARDLLDKSASELELEDSKTVYSERTREFGEADKNLQLLKEHEKMLSVVVRQVRALDMQMSTKQENLTDIGSAISGLRERISVSEGQLRKTFAELQQERNTAGASEAYLAGNGEDARLVSSLSGIDAALRQYDEVHRSETEALVALELADKELENAGTQLHKLQPEIERRREALKICSKRRIEITARLESLLSGSDIRVLRREVDVLQARSRSLETLSAKVSTVVDVEERIGALQQEIQVLDAKQSRSAAEIERLSQLRQRDEQIVQGLEREAELLMKVRSFEEERRLLLDGEPCPLCGSDHHPYADAEAPEREHDGDGLRNARELLQDTGHQITELRIELAGTVREREHHDRQISELQNRLTEERKVCSNLALSLDVSCELSSEPVEKLLSAARHLARTCLDVLADAERLEEDRTNAEAHEQQLLQELTEAVRQEDAAGYGVKIAAEEVRRRSESCRKATEQRTLLQENLDRELAGYGIVAKEGYSYGDAWLELRTRLEQWQEASDRRTSAIQRISALDENLKVQTETLQMRMQELAEKERQQAASQAVCKAFQEERRTLFGEKNPEEEEARLDGELKRAEEALETVRLTRDKAARQIEVLSAQIAMLAASSEARAGEIGQKQSQLLQELICSGFESLGSFLSARLDRSLMEKLDERSRRLTARRHELETLRLERRNKLLQEETRALTMDSPEALQQELEGISGNIGNLRSEIATLKLRLHEHDRDALLLREKNAALSARQSECARWSALHELIGSADGKKYRNFAQGLTFEIMIGYANRQLVNMTDRYLLVRDEAEPLALNVVDNWQAGEVRSTRNLSGGESFIVSLALALGLSQMSSRNVRIDSLFLDEGFGTLDEDSLETALETLAGLQQSGKLIGIISHVPALKERIATHIQVSPLSAGRSALAGPGVSGA
jgi:exonuclease SbcC